MHSELLKKFAADLKAAREEKQISLNHIAAKTRIDLKYLTAIDNANFDVLPDLYVRAFIKEYAANIDLNPEETVKKYDMARSGKAEAPVYTETEVEGLNIVSRKATKTIKKHYESEEVEAYAPKEDNRKSLDPRFLYAGIGAAVIILIAGLYFIFFTETTIEKDTLSSVRNEQQTDTRMYEEPVSQQSAPAVSGDSLQLQIIANDLVWFTVSSDDAVPVQYLFKNTQQTTVKAMTKFVLNIGNAGGVKLILDGKTLDPIGRPGDVKNVQIDKEGVKFLTLERPKNERAPAKGN